tara:strand:- start:96 stop:344 length:249 start_codon:yes stop_codon:yes gene_type:complete
MSQFAETNKLKKGTRVVLRNGWQAVLEDNKKGSIRMATVEGFYTEMGSIYANDIAGYKEGDFWVKLPYIGENFLELLMRKAA